MFRQAIARSGLRCAVPRAYIAPPRMIYGAAAGYRSWHGPHCHRGRRSLPGIFFRWAILVAGITTFISYNKANKCAAREHQANEAHRHYPPPPLPTPAPRSVPAPYSDQNSRGVEPVRSSNNIPTTPPQGTSQLDAFNPVTREIDWQSPSLNGMPEGPCGEDFKAAFSCFVYSDQVPKGSECVSKFAAMQDCFRLYPDIYRDAR